MYVIAALEPAVQGTAAEVSNVGAQPVLRSSPRLLRQRHNRPPLVPIKKVPAKRKMPDSAAADAPSSRRTRQSNASFRPEDDPGDEDDDSEDDDDFVVEDVQAGKGSSKRVKSSGAGSSRGPSTSVPAGGGTAVSSLFQLVFSSKAHILWFHVIGGQIDSFMLVW